MITTGQTILHVTAPDDVAALAEALCAPDSDGRAIVALTSRKGQRYPALDPDDIRRIVGDDAEVYFIEDGSLTHELGRLLPPKFQVYGGAARIWWPPIDERSDPLDHPLIHDCHGVYSTKALEIFRLRFESGPPTNRRGVADPQRKLAIYERDEARRRRGVLEQENYRLTHRGDRAIERAEAAERRARDARREARAASGGRPERQDTMDAPAVLRRAVLDAWLETFREDERNRYPLGVYRIGHTFTTSVELLPPAAQDRVPWVCAMVLCARAQELQSLELHRLRGGPGGEEAPLTRERDGATAWRCAVKRNTPGAARLHYWRSPDGSVELASVGHHDDFEIPE